MPDNASVPPGRKDAPKAAVTLARDTVPIREKAAFSMLAVAQQLGGNGVRMFVFPAYGIILEVDPGIIGTSLALMLLYDAIIDPLCGWLSDNTRTCWGRRRPYLLGGAVLGGLTFILLWMAQPGWSTGQKLGYYVGTSFVFYAALTALVVPGTALGWELTSDYEERTRVMSWYSVVAKIVNIVMPWMFALTQARFWSDQVQGLRGTAVIFGVGFIVTGIIPALVCQEREQRAAAPKEKQSLLATVKMSFGNKTYMTICGMTLTTIFGGTVLGAFGSYITVYYLYAGEAAAGSMLLGISGTASSVVGLVTILIINRYFRHTDKREVLLVCVLLSLIGWISAIVFITPANPWLSLIPAALNGPAQAGFWLVILSMIGDACDDDELKTGRRREGALAAFVSFINKGAATLGSALGGFALTWAGFNASLSVQTDATLAWMKAIYIGMPVVSFLIVLVLAWHYPLTRSRVEEIQRELLRRREEAASS